MRSISGFDDFFYAIRLNQMQILKLNDSLDSSPPSTKSVKESRQTSTYEIRSCPFSTHKLSKTKRNNNKKIFII